jgi:hypothetical protein
MNPSPADASVVLDLTRPGAFNPTLTNPNPA